MNREEKDQLAELMFEACKLPGMKKEDEIPTIRAIIEESSDEECAMIKKNLSDPEVAQMAKLLTLANAMEMDMDDESEVEQKEDLAG